MTPITIPESQVSVELEPGTVPRWQAEDSLVADLGSEDDQPAELSHEEALNLLTGLRLTLPAQIAATELVTWAAERNTPLSLAIPADLAKYSYYLAEIPTNILAPEHKLTRLCLSLRFISDPDSAATCACDLFPKDAAQFTTTELGSISLDVSKALCFAVGQSLADCIGFTLKLPLTWKSQTVRIETSDQRSNPLEWFLADSSIQQGFTGYAIVQVPRGAKLTIQAHLACEVRTSGLMGIFRKATLVSKVRSYAIA